MNIYVGNLSLNTTREELCKEFIEFGEVISVTLMNDSYIGSGQTRGYGYVQMSSKSAGAAAIANLSGKLLRDHPISLVEALPLTKNGAPPGIKNNNRSYKKRERNYAIKVCVTGT